MDKSVWVIEKGSYSDYRVVGVYSTQERAKLVCEHINKDGVMNLRQLQNGRLTLG